MSDFNGPGHFHVVAWKREDVDRTSGITRIFETREAMEEFYDEGYDGWNNVYPCNCDER